MGPSAFGSRRLENIRVEGNEYLADRFLERETNLRRGEPFDFDRALDALDHLYSTSLLQGAWVDFHPTASGDIELEVRVVEQYRNTADIGLAYQSDDQVQGFLRLETRDLFGGGERLQLNSFASARDLRLGLSLLGEQVFGAHFGYMVDVEFHEEKPKFFEGTEFVNRAEFDRQHIRLGFNWQLGHDHLGQAGFLLGSVKLREQLGLDYEPGTETMRRIFARYTWDRLDSLELPRSGIRVNALGERNEEGLGATSSYWRIDADVRLARALGPVVLDGRARYGFSSGHLPVSEWFITGGPELIPGVAREELWGQQTAAGSITVGFDPVSIARVYGRVGLGGVWEQPGDIGWNEVITGFGFGTTIATPIGPVQIDYGWAEEGRNRLYLAIGWQ